LYPRLWKIGKGGSVKAGSPPIQTSEHTPGASGVAGVLTKTYLCPGF